MPLDVPEFAMLYEWLAAAEQVGNHTRKRKAAPVTSLEEVFREPHRFVAVVFHHPDDVIAEPPYLVDLALDEAIVFRRTRAMGTLNKMSLHGVKWMGARKRSRKLLESFASGRQLSGDKIV